MCFLVWFVFAILLICVLLASALFRLLVFVGFLCIVGFCVSCSGLLLIWRLLFVGLLSLFACWLLFVVYYVPITCYFVDVGWLFCFVCFWWLVVRLLWMFCYVVGSCYFTYCICLVWVDLWLFARFVWLVGCELCWLLCCLVLCVLLFVICTSFVLVGTCVLC